MGTTNRAFNWFKRAVNSLKAVHIGKDTALEPEFQKHTMMQRKDRGFTGRRRAYHGLKRKDHHFYGGCREFDDRAIFFPKRKKYRRYPETTFNKRRFKAA